MWRDDAYLLDILLAAKRAKEFASDITWEQFQKSSLHQHAIMKTLEIIGEAANKISQEVRDVHPEITLEGNGWNEEQVNSRVFQHKC